jgi:hypothetical protein
VLWVCRRREPPAGMWLGGVGPSAHRHCGGPFSRNGPPCCTHSTAQAAKRMRGHVGRTNKGSVTPPGAPTAPMTRSFPAAKYASIFWAPRRAFPLSNRSSVMFLNMHLDMFPAMFNNTSLIFEKSASRTKRSPEALQAQQCDLFAPMKSRWCILAHQFPGNLSRAGTGHPLARDGVDVGERRARLLREVRREPHIWQPEHVVLRTFAPMKRLLLRCAGGRRCCPARPARECPRVPRCLEVCESPATAAASVRACALPILQTALHAEALFLHPCLRPTSGERPGKQLRPGAGARLQITGGNGVAGCQRKPWAVIGMPDGAQRPGAVQIPLLPGPGATPVAVAAAHHPTTGPQALRYILCGS